jgi:hypothetical protein
MAPPFKINDILTKSAGAIIDLAQVGIRIEVRTNSIAI